MLAEVLPERRELEIEGVRQGVDVRLVALLAEPLAHHGEPLAELVVGLLDVDMVGLTSTPATRENASAVSASGPLVAREFEALGFVGRRVEARPIASYYSLIARGRRSARCSTGSKGGEEWIDRSDRGRNRSPPDAGRPAARAASKNGSSDPRGGPVGTALLGRREAFVASVTDGAFGSEPDLVVGDFRDLFGSYLTGVFVGVPVEPGFELLRDPGVA